MKKFVKFMSKDIDTVSLCTGPYDFFELPRLNGYVISKSTA